MHLPADRRAVHEPLSNASAAATEAPALGAGSQHSKADIAFHAARAATYDRDVAEQYRIYDEFTLVPFLDRMAARGRDQRVLDLGCGTGEVALHLAARGFRVTALDHSPQMLAVAKDKAAAEGLTEFIAFIVGDIADLPFPAAEFDGVTCQRVLHHMPDVAPVVSEVDRVLKVGGFFYLSDSLGDSTAAARALKSAWRWILERRRDQRAAPGESLPSLPDGHEVMRPAGEILALLDASGFSCDAEFFTHVGLVDRLSPSVRALLIRALALPWKSRRGDLMFAYATKK